MEEERKPNEPIKPAAPGQQGGGQESDRDKEKEREKQGGGQEGGGGQQGGQQGGGQQSGSLFSADECENYYSFRSWLALNALIADFES
ncbi:MAG: hypothetical protein DME91_04205 [Verrucomicrobia bacterium]|nr:MAG: hypothetical protein DME91_04205 [Verrucomicrobiota bacterium]